tara:strand:- start:2268 stop:3761 length:1494 start_codon:yes stop_codon:yes gene_type:complete
MAKRTKRRNKRYSHKKNSKKKRVSKKRRQRVSRKVSKKTYKHKNMRGGAHGHSNAGMTDEEALAAALEASRSEAGAGAGSGAYAFDFIGAPAAPAPVEGSNIIYNILQSRGQHLLQYYHKLLENGYDDKDIEDSDFLDALKISLQFIVPQDHLMQIIGAFEDHIGAAPAPAGAERGGLTVQQQQQLAAQLMAQNAINQASGTGGSSASVYAPAPAPAPAAGGFGAGAMARMPDWTGKRINFYSNREADSTCNKYYELTNYWDRLDKEGRYELDKDVVGKGRNIYTADLPARLPRGNYLFHDGVRPWKSSEHRFQIHKCIEGPDRIRLYEMSKDMGTGQDPRYGIGPDWAFQNITSRGLERSDWGDVRMKVMYNTLLFKFHPRFGGNQHCYNVLQRTRDRLLVENAGTHDTFWGDGAAKNTHWDPWNVKDFKKDTWNGDKPDGSQRGYNWLGLLLMQIRDVIFGDNFCISVFGVLPFNPLGHPRNGEGFFLDTDGTIL